MLRGKLGEAIPLALPEELTTVLVQSDGLRIERIVSRGHGSPGGFWYEQDEHEFVLLVAGRACIEVEGCADIELAAGDWLDIPARSRHRVRWTDPATDTIWLAVFYRDRASVTP